MKAPWRVSPASTRLRDAGLGLALTVKPLAAIACAQFVLARHTVRVVGGMDPNIDTWAIAQFRSALITFYASVFCIVLTYWLLTAALGRSQILAIKSANVTMVFSGLLFGCAMAVASTVPAPAMLLKVACPILNLSDVYPKFGFDNRTACEAFANAILPLLLLGVPTLLLAASAIFRISGSRHRP